MADYFDLAGKHYLVIADRLSGWPEVIQVTKGTGAASLCSPLRQMFVRFGVPADCSSDGGQEFTSNAVKDLFQSWGVHHIVSSAFLAKSNGRAELAVKATKRLLRDNVASDGSLDTDKFIRAMFTKRNTPDSYSKLSPAEIVLGRKFSDALPILPKDIMFVKNEHFDPMWHKLWRQREVAMQDMFIRNLEKVNKSNRRLQPLGIGQHVLIQNQHGPHPLRWERTGVIVDCKEFDQYIVKVHGSNRLTIRNRQFLRSYDLPANLGKQNVSSPDLQQPYMNKGAGKQKDSMEDVHVHVPPPAQGIPEPREVSRGSVDRVQGETSSDLENRVYQGSGQTAVQRDPLAIEPGPPAVQEPVMPQPQPSVRRSSRANKGETSRYKDFVTGEDVEEL